MMEGVMVKDEPLDPEYGDELGSTEEVEPKIEMETDISNEDSNHLTESTHSSVNTGDRKQKIQSVIDNLLQKNDEILESADINHFKVVTKTNYEVYNSVEFGRIFRLKNPTNNCYILPEEKLELKDYLVELSVGNVNVEDIFEKMKYEVVCGIVSKAYTVKTEMDEDIKFYWCNFCRFKSLNREVLFNHVTEHRFNCKYCDYQSFSRANVISHTERMHTDFREISKLLKYCIFKPDYIALSNENKRPIKEKSGPAPKRTRRNRTESQENEEYVAFDMEVEEVEDESNYTPSNSESTDRIMTPRSKKKNQNGPAASGLPKSSLSNNLNVGKSTVIESSASKQSSGPSVPPPLSSGNMQTTTTGKSGNTVTVSSGLCWNCGYCNFVTLSQTFLKTHLNSHHSGKAHKYVAMLVSSQEEMNKIKERDAKMFTQPNLPLLYGSGNQTQEKNLSPPQDGSGQPSSTKNPDSATSVAGNEDVQEEDSDEEYIPEEEKKKYPLTYKCAHCNFNAPVCFIVKEHLNMKHQGCVLYALDMRAVKLKQRRYVFFCHRKNCSFTTKKTDEYLSHSENCTPWLLENCPEEVNYVTKKCLELTRNFSTKISQKAFQMAKNFKASKSAEYACTHCSYTSNNNTRVKRHILTNHEDLKTVLKDLQSHKMKKKTHVYFCRHCLWETRNEDELGDHLQEKHEEEEKSAASSSIPPVKETVEKKTPRQASSRSVSSKPDPVSQMEDDIKEEEEEEDREEEIDLHLEVSEEDMQKMMTEFVKDEAGRGSSPGRPARKASIEASVRVRAQGHQPPMYKCMHCTHLCFGSNLMKKHIRSNHKNEALRTVDVKKRISRQFAYYCICPKDNCTFVNAREEIVLNHALQQHKMRNDHPEIQKMLQPFAAQSSSNAETKSSSKGASAFSSLVGFECLYCSTSYVTKEMNQMKIHIKEQHPSEEIIFRDCIARKMRRSSRIYMCERDNCEYYTSEQKELELHKLAHEKAHIFECSECQWFTTTTDSVHAHMETVHSGEQVTTINMNLDLDEQGQVIKKVGGMIIKQEKQDPEQQEDSEPVYSDNETTNLGEFIIKSEPMD